MPDTPTVLKRKVGEVNDPKHGTIAMVYETESGRFAVTAFAFFDNEEAAKQFAEYLVNHRAGRDVKKDAGN